MKYFKYCITCTVHMYFMVGFWLSIHVGNKINYS